MRDIDGFGSSIAHLPASSPRINSCALTIPHTLGGIIESTEFNASKIMEKYEDLI